MSSPKRVLTAALTLSALGLTSMPYPARAIDVLGTLNQTLEQQAAAGIISETGALPVPAQSVPSSTVGQQGTGIISEGAQSPLGQQVGGAVQNTADNVINGAGGQVGSAIGGILGHGSGIPSQIFRPFEQQMQKYIGAAEDFLHNAVGDILGSIFGHAGGNSAGGGGDAEAGGANGDNVAGAIGADVPPGAMGLPDFYKAQKAIKDKAMGGANGDPAIEAQRADRFNVNPVALARSLSSEQDRTLDKTIAASVLSDAGQQAMTDERTAADQTLQLIQTKATEAQSLDVTQDVMKNMAVMLAGQASLDSGNYAHTMLIHQQMAANGVVETNISEALDEANRARHVEAMAGATGLLRSASSVYLPGG